MSRTFAFLRAINVGGHTATMARLQTLRTSVDAFSTLGREVWWLCRVKQSESTFSNAVFEKALGIKATFRGFNTLHRLAAKYLEA